MSLEFLIYANLLLITRLYFLNHDQTLSPRQLIGLSSVQILGLSLVFQWNPAFFCTLAVIGGASALALATRRKIDPAKGFRLISLFGLLLIPGYLASLTGGFSFSPGFEAFARHMGAHMPFLDSLEPDSLRYLSGILLGVLLLANETNIGIRAAFHHLKLEPIKKGKTDEVDQQEYNAGRVIGILERWLMFFVVAATSDLSALAFIIAAKGLARMKQLEDRKFAEYMLVGTLLSAVCAVLIGFWVKSMA